MSKKKMHDQPFEEMGFAKLDHHRAMRRGFPEAIFCSGKTQEQVLEIADRILRAQGSAILTKVDGKLASALKRRFKGKVEHVPMAGLVFLGRTTEKLKGKVAVVTAGTSDISVAEEAASVCERFGVKVERVYDVGVAGVHRVIPSLPIINNSDVVIVVAGMEGALPSVIAGLTDRPVVAVPTGIGYGANFKGIAALLGMLCSCSPGIAIVNIDNGFGAGVFALSIIRLARSKN
jgi:pyridinium-3,5-biscarboxylic acid mononucleotide synthase